MVIESLANDIYIDLEVEQQNVFVDLDCEKSDIELTEQKAEILRGAKAKENMSDWLEYDLEDWEQLSVSSYRLTIPKSEHKFNNPFIVEMLLIDEDGCENNLRPTYRVSANDSVVIFSDTPVNCKIKIGGEQ